MNVLCIGSGVVGADMAAELVRAFLAAEFDGGERYRRRLEKIEAMEREAAMPESRLHQLSALGQSVWIDSLSREWLRTESRG